MLVTQFCASSRQSPVASLSPYPPATSYNFQGRAFVASSIILGEHFAFLLYFLIFQLIFIPVSGLRNFVMSQKPGNSTQAYAGAVKFSLTKFGKTEHISPTVQTWIVIKGDGRTLFQRVINGREHQTEWPERTVTVS